MSRRAFSFVVLIGSLLLLQTTLTNVSDAQHSTEPPIAKEGLLKSLSFKRLHHTLVRQVKVRGVDFHMTASDETEIRRKGEYLGKKELDDLIEAIRHNFRCPPTPPESTDTFHEKFDNVYISVGGFTGGWPVPLLEKGQRVQVIAFAGDAIEAYMECGKLYVDASLYNGLGASPIEVRHNDFAVLPPNWDRNFNISAFEVVNEERFPIFQMIYEAPNRIHLNGLFFHRGGLFFANGNEFTLNPKLPLELRYERLFKYPSWQHQGEINETPPSALPVRKLTYSQEVVSSDKEDAPYAVKVVIQTNVTMQPTSLVVRCDSEFAASKPMVLGAPVLMHAGEGYIANRTAYWFYFAEPAFRAENPVVILLMAKQPIHVLDVQEGPPIPR
jgi:hypothetical protein